jgi:hypothetical protein
MGKDKSDIKIDKKIKNETSKCEKDFACLSDDNYKLCNVVRSVHDNVIFIECLEWKPCNYRMSFGISSYICNCPVRKEIYKKYEK